MQLSTLGSSRAGEALCWICPRKIFKDDQPLGSSVGCVQASCLHLYLIQTVASKKKIIGTLAKLWVKPRGNNFSILRQAVCLVFASTNHLTSPHMLPLQIQHFLLEGRYQVGFVKILGKPCVWLFETCSQSTAFSETSQTHCFAKQWH